MAEVGGSDEPGLATREQMSLTTLLLLLLLLLLPYRAVECGVRFFWRFCC